MTMSSRSCAVAGGPHLEYKRGGRREDARGSYGGVWEAVGGDVDPFTSLRIALDDINQAFELMERQDGIRSVIVF
jgi:hypothetical protein